ncbi:hypothetical protein NP233_g5393 [Leucocoprinus birnbaumii]|uniref:Uncharacterized protein n=1 Tax=Leucocoprinus birnbaumii TaxID=56174 RepID=A0AAD5VZ87_9AGAR|nr:hypothetical protein NP233_g5393 [Leucocoprinus birnbaumii]
MTETHNPLLQAVSRTEVVTLTTVEGTLYGLSFALYLTCCRLLLLELSKNKERRRQNLFTLSFMSLIMTCGLLNLVADTRGIQVSWVDHPTAAPGSSLIYEANVYFHSAIAGMGYVVAMLIELLTNGTQLGAPWVHRLALVLIFGWIVLVTDLDLVIEIMAISDEIGHQIFIGSQGLVITTIQQGLTMLAGVVVTSLIGARIALVRRKHIQIMGKSEVSNQYFSIISMLVESFALEFIWMTINIATYFSDDIQSRSVDEIIAYLLVVYRVSTGRAWEKDTEAQLSSLQWNRDAQQTTQLTTTRASAHISDHAPDAQV